MKRSELFTVVKEAWGTDTSASPEIWSAENRSLGQCAVTACLLQDYLGGEILNTVPTLPDGSTDSHYYNVIDGKEIDLTRSQFPDGTTFTEGIPKTGKHATTREYVLDNPATRDRYEILKERVMDRLRNL